MRLVLKVGSLVNVDDKSLIIRNIAQKVVAKSGFGCKFHDLKYFEVGFLFYIFLEFIINLRENYKMCRKMSNLCIFIMF